MAFPIPVTLMYGGACGLLVTGLGAYVSASRGKFKSFIGDAPPPELQRIIRAHGNASEWVPLGVLLLLLLEVSGLGSLPLHLLGGGFLLARLLHAMGVIGKSPLSAAGAGLNYLAVGGMAIWAIVRHFPIG